jgi:hypothetical protein
MMSYYPLPNRRPQDVYNTNNFYLRGNQDFTRNTVNSRLDYQMGKHSLYWTPFPGNYQRLQFVGGQ